MSAAAGQQVWVSPLLQRARQRLEWCETEISEMEKQEAVVEGEDKSKWQQQQLEWMRQSLELQSKEIKLMEMAEVLLRQRAESEAAAAAAAAAAAEPAAAAAAEPAAEPASVSEPEWWNRGQPLEDHAPMPTCAGLLRNIIWRKQTGYARLVDSSSQDQDKKTQ